MVDWHLLKNSPWYFLEKYKRHLRVLLTTSNRIGTLLNVGVCDQKWKFRKFAVSQETKLVERKRFTLQRLTLITS